MNDETTRQDGILPPRQICITQLATAGGVRIAMRVLEELAVENVNTIEVVLV